VFHKPVLCQGTTSHAAEKLIRSRKKCQGTTSQVAEKLVSAVVLKGHDFNRADKANRMNRALAPEGRFLSGFAIPLGFFRSLFSHAEKDRNNEGF
jgi:hypothetical protein